MKASLAGCAAIAVIAGGAAWLAARTAPAPLPLAAAGPQQVLPAPAIEPAPGGTARTHSSPGTWRLASYITEPLSWRRKTGGGPAAGGYLACPAPGTCYYAGAAGGGSPSGPTYLSTLYVSRDGGLSWTAIRLPGGASFTTALACPAGGGCLAGGEISGHPVLLMTGDGGHHWSYRALPPPDGTLTQPACPAAARCRAVATESGHRWFLRTDDAGAHWHGLSFPAGASVQALTCPTVADCVAVGSGRGHRNLLGDPAGVILRTADEGRTWSAGVLPAGLFFGYDVGSVACAGPSTCYALGLHPVRDGATVEHFSDGSTAISSATCPGPVTANPPRCQGGTYDDVGAVAVSSDGGASWRLLALPPHTPLPVLLGLSCPTPRACWIAGTQAVPQVVPGGPDHRGTDNGGSAMILATSDGGAAWSKTTFPVQRLAGGQQADSLMAVGEIACPTVTSCVGVGVAEQGSYHTPVYINAG